MSKKTIAVNKKATFDYFIEDTIEAGIMLIGNEVKSIVNGKVNISSAHATNEGNEIYLYNCHIAEPKNVKSNYNEIEPNRRKKLLLHRSEIKRLIGKITVKGYTLIVKSLYLNKKNLVKVELALGVGKKLRDKRQVIKERDWKKQQGRILRNKY